jgi:hypothetical protein
MYHEKQVMTGAFWEKAQSQCILGAWSSPVHLGNEVKPIASWEQCHTAAFWEEVNPNAFWK